MIPSQKKISSDVPILILKGIRYSLGIIPTIHIVPQEDDMIRFFKVSVDDLADWHPNLHGYLQQKQPSPVMEDRSGVLPFLVSYLLYRTVLVIHLCHLSKN